MMVQFHLMESMMIQPEPAAEARNWLELPTEVISMILLKLDAVEILTKAQNVCSLWRKICKDPLMWRVISMQNSWCLDDFGYFDYRNPRLEIMCKHAVDRSCGQLVGISIGYFGTDDLLQYITQSSNQLRNLRMVSSYDISEEGLRKAVSKLPLLEHLEIFHRSVSVETLKTVGRSCPLLKSLKLIQPHRRGTYPRDEVAIAIAETLPKILQLQLFGNGLSNSGLQAILDGCPDLESLDLRNCFNLNLSGEFGKRCAERIKILHLPHDPQTYFGDSDYEDYSHDYDDFDSYDD